MAAYVIQASAGRGGGIGRRRILKFPVSVYGVSQGQPESNRPLKLLVLLQLRLFARSPTITANP